MLTYGGYNDRDVIIDFHTHIISPRLTRQRDSLMKRDKTFEALFSDSKAVTASCEDLITAMDRVGVSKSVVLGYGWCELQIARENNDYIIDSANRFPERLIPFCSVNPAWGRDAVQEIERCAELGIKGIGELHPDTQEFVLSDIGTMSPIMDVARSHNLVVLTHASEPLGHEYPGKGQTTPDVLARFVNLFPENKIVAAHWGGGLPFYLLMPEIMQASSNLFFDTATSVFLYDSRVFSVGVEAAGADKILFGSDYPLVSQDRIMKDLRKNETNSDIESLILYKNACKLLGIATS